MALNEKTLEGADSGNPTPQARKKPVLLIVAVVLICVATVFAVRFIQFNAVHVATDDAGIASDIVQIAPQVSGRVVEVPVHDNQEVKAGQLLLVLDDTSYKTAVANAKANLDLAIAQAKGAGASVSLTSQTTTAQIAQAQGGVLSADGGIGAARADVAQAQAGAMAAKASAMGASANVLAARAGLDMAVAGLSRTQDAVRSSQAILATAQSGVRAAKASLVAAVATEGKAEREAKRLETLFSQGATSGQVADQARATADVAHAQVMAAQEQVAQAQSLVVQRESELRSAKNDLITSSATISQAKAQLSAAIQQAAAASQGVNQSLAARQAAEQAVRVAAAKANTAVGQLKQAQTAPAQINVSKSGNEQALARVEQARAVLRDAEINLERTRIYAPFAGRVTRKTVTPGALLAVGTPTMSLVQDDDLWVVANYKETQLTDVKVGQETEVEVDAFPGKTFKARVHSISAGTGATFALLPPDNSTGNFTKVVQRIPVKITFEKGQPGLDDLRVGMSVTATIKTH